MKIGGQPSHLQNPAEAWICGKFGEEVILESSTDSTAIEAREKAVSTRPPAAEAPALLADFVLAQVVGISPVSTPKQAPSPTVVERKGQTPKKIKRKHGRPRKGQEPPEPDPTRLQIHLSGSYEANLLDMPEVSCTYGSKGNAKGPTAHWIGYKLHASTGDGEIPWQCI